MENISEKNLAIALNVLYDKKEDIYPAYVSKHNSNREKQVILLMIPNGDGWHYFAVKKLSALLRSIMSKHHGDFFCRNCLHLFATENKCESHTKLCENEDLCDIVVPTEDTKILELNQYQKSDKAPEH